MDEIYVMSAQLRQVLANYLATKPYNEVAGLLSELNAMPAADKPTVQPSTDVAPAPAPADAKE